MSDLSRSADNTRSFAQRSIISGLFNSPLTNSFAAESHGESSFVGARDVVQIIGPRRQDCQSHRAFFSSPAERDRPWSILAEIEQIAFSAVFDGTPAGGHVKT